MKALELQEQALRVESDLNRLALQAELRHLRARRGWLRLGSHAGRQVAAWGVVLTPLVGAALALGLRRSARLLTAGVRVLKATQANA